MRRNNKGLEISKIESYSIEHGATYKSLNYTSQLKMDRVKYTFLERQIIGQCVINGKDYRVAKRLVMSNGGNDTILNPQTFTIINRIRDYKGTEGVRHWMENNRKLDFYIKWCELDMENKLETL